jgi:hypothetical protein
MSGSCFRVWKGVSILLTTILLMYIYTACWLNNHVVQLCPFWCSGYSARLSRPFTCGRLRPLLGKMTEIGDFELSRRCSLEPGVGDAFVLE